MDCEKMHANPHDRAVKRETEAGNDRKLGQGVAMAFTAAVRIAIVEVIIDQSRKYVADRRCEDGVKSAMDERDENDINEGKWRARLSQERKEKPAS
jgi:hypothetical protein